MNSSKTRVFFCTVPAAVDSWRRAVGWLTRATAIPALLMSASLCQAEQSVTLARDRSPDSNIASYTPYYGTEKGRPSQSMSVGNVTAATIGNLNDATTYYFTVRAMNTMGLQSEPSNKVAHTTSDAAAFRLTVNNGSGSGNYIAGTIVTVSSNPPPSGKAFDRWLDGWVVQRLGFL